MIRAFFASSLLMLAVAAGQNPDAKALVERARLTTTLQKASLDGQLSSKAGKTPIHLFLNGEDIQFVHGPETAPERFHMRLQDDKYDLFEITNGKTTRFPAAKLVQPVDGSDLSYEDLSFQFLYWPEPKLEGIENVADQDCYKIRLNKPPGSAGRYEVVYVWIQTAKGALTKVCGFDKKGAMLKQFEVENVMQITGGAWTVKDLKVSTMNPTTSRASSVTKVHFEDATAAPKAPKSIR